MTKLDFTLAHEALTPRDIFFMAAFPGALLVGLLIAVAIRYYWMEKAR